MRFQCSFNLDPVLHEQDGFAVANLRAWQVSEKKRTDDRDTSQQRRSIFNRNIYLSGLYLHQLSADLPRLISEQYNANGVSVKRLTQQVALFDGAIEAQPEIAAVETSNYVVLEDSQWQKFESMLEKHHQSVVDKQQENLRIASETHAENVNQSAMQLQAGIKKELQEELKQQLADPLSEQIAALSVTSLIEQVSKKLTELQLQQQQTLVELQQQLAEFSRKSEAVSVVAEPSELSSESDHQLNIDTLLDDNKNDLLAAININQKNLMSAFNGLKKQISGLSNNLSSGMTTSGEEQQEIEVLNTQLRRASKVKAKGLW
jgi:hypothetical protein